MWSVVYVFLLLAATTAIVVSQESVISSFSNSPDFFAQDGAIVCNPPTPFPSVCQRCCCGAPNFYCAVAGMCCCSQSDSACCGTICCDFTTQNCCNAPTQDGNGVQQVCDVKPTISESLAIGNLTSAVEASDTGLAVTAIPPPQAGEFRTYAMPVGQGDCTILQCPNGNIVFVDCGSSSTAGLTAQDITNFLGTSIGNVVAILISHPDDDHSNYLPNIGFNANTVASIIIGGQVNQYNPDVRNWFNTFPPGVVKVIHGGVGCINNCTLPAGTNLNFCADTNIRFNVLAANVINMTGRPNEVSAVWRVDYNAFSLLLPGDMEGPASTIVTNQLGPTGLLSVTHYKMAHHGASTSANRPAWLNQIRPIEAFASNAYSFGNCRHPRCLTITRLLQLNTVLIAPVPHTLSCGTSTGTSTLNPFCRRIYSTAPTQNLICLIIINTNGAAAVTSLDCQPVQAAAVLLEGAADTDVCGAETERCDADTDRCGAASNTVAFLAMGLCLLYAFLVV